MIFRWFGEIFFLFRSCLLVSVVIITIIIITTVVINLLVHKHIADLDPVSSPYNKSIFFTISSEAHLMGLSSVN